MLLHDLPCKDEEKTAFHLNDLRDVFMEIFKTKRSSRLSNSELNPRIVGISGYTGGFELKNSLWKAASHKIPKLEAFETHLQKSFPSAVILPLFTKYEQNLSEGS
jgi:hypothetical protein